MSLSGYAQAVLHKDLKKDFGAVADGRTNDQAAFARAAAFFNQRAQTPAGAGRAVLHLPKGTYLVGPTSPGSMPDLLPLRGCRNLAILGDDSATTEIRYAEGLRYGAFDPTTQLPYEAATAWFTDGKYYVGLGTCLSLQQCENIEVADLTLNGNSAHAIVGGHWGDVGIQINYDGLGVGDSRRVRLRRLAVHHFGRDGIQIMSHLSKSLDDPAREGMVLENSRFEYNGRQGLSLTGINGLRVTNCSFSHTGRVLIPGLGKPLYSNPGAGVDVEPEGGYATNVRFEHCRLVDNAGQALVSDRYGNGPPTVKNVVLHDCLLWGTTNWSAWVRQTGFLFESCRIYGAFVTGSYLAASPTRFVGCTFEDLPYREQPAYGQHLVYSNREARAMSFTNCRFVGTRNYLLLAVPAAPDSVSRFRLRSCTFELNYAEQPLGAANIMSSAIFSGRTSFQNGLHKTDSVRTDFQLGNPEAAGSVVVPAGSSLRLAAAGSRYSLQNGLTVGSATGKGAASVEVGSGNELVLREQPGQTPELSIGPNSRLVVRRGGRLVLEPRTKLLVAGQLVLEEGAYFYQSPLAEVKQLGNGRLRVK